MDVSCIIPFFNERERIGKVLEQVVKAPSIDEIICIDDGSTDKSSEFIHKQYPQIKLIKNPKNSGKTEAVKAGLKQAKGGYILLLDADLRDLQYREIEQALKKTISRNADMVILRLVRALRTMWLVRGDILISGERIVRKADLEKVLKKNVKKFQLEAAINQYMFENKKSVFWTPISARNTYKFKKIAFLKGWYEMTTVAVDIIFYLGLKNYLRQLLFFCRKKLV